MFKNNVVAGIIEICDHCSKKVDTLWCDYAGWMFCPNCWAQYHAYEPEKEAPSEEIVKLAQYFACAGISCETAAGALRGMINALGGFQDVMDVSDIMRALDAPFDLSVFDQWAAIDWHPETKLPRKLKKAIYGTRSSRRRLGL